MAIEKFIRGHTPLCIVQGRTEDWLAGADGGIDRFAVLGGFWYVSFLAGADTDSCERFTLRYRWAVEAARLAEDHGVQLQRVVWIDPDTFWVGPRNPGIKTFTDTFYFTPYDLLFLSGFAGQRPKAKHHSLLQTGIIGLSRFGLSEIERLYPKILETVRRCAEEGTLLDQAAMIRLLGEISEDACVLILELRDLIAHNRVYNGQPFVHVAGLSHAEKLQFASVMRRLYPL